jgi:hypothetical protein
MNPMPMPPTTPPSAVAFGSPMNPMPMPPTTPPSAVA